MNLTNLQKKFQRIGAELNVSYQEDWLDSWGWWESFEGFTLDTATDKGKEHFVLSVNKDQLADLHLEVIDVNPSIRHLLLLSKREDEWGQIKKDKFLCGFDERHWFVSELSRRSRSVSDVWSALEALKPLLAISSQKQNKVKRKHWHARQNDGFYRQGEWFFIREPHFSPGNKLAMLKNEPLRRNWMSKPHILEEAYREGGNPVYVSKAYPTGIEEKAYRNLLNEQPELAKLKWRQMRRNPWLYARGKVRHKDHSTLYLPGWHKVLKNAEGGWSTSVAFLD